MNPLIECKDLVLGYENSIIVADVNLSIYSGDYLCIVGDNGSGKSTLIKGFLGLLKPLKGSISVDKDLQAKSIGYLPQQNPSSGDFPATIFEVVLSGCLSRRGIRPFYSNKEKNLALQNLDRLNISSLKTQRFCSLSGGQKQRVLIARALCATDKLLILDEPTTGLDPSTTIELYQIVKDLNENYGVAIIMVSHDVQNIITHAKNILHLRHKPLFYGTADDYRTSNAGKSYLGGSDHD